MSNHVNVYEYFDYLTLEDIDNCRKTLFQNTEEIEEKFHELIHTMDLRMDYSQRLLIKDFFTKGYIAAHMKKNLEAQKIARELNEKLR